MITRLVVLCLVAALGTACASTSAEPQSSRTIDRPDDESDVESGDPPAGARPEPAAPVERSPAAPRPAWLGTRVLPIAANGFGEVQPTPPELIDRRLETPEILPPPTSDDFAVSVVAVPTSVVDRSTWSPDCPVGLDELRYVTLPFWGFDERLHTGELLVHVDAVAAVTSGFRTLFDLRFAIEEIRVVHPDELDAPPTGDGNNTTSFVCRPSVGSSRWSQHTYGMAVDVNPFHNPYVKGDVVLPELASSYLDRADVRPGMLDSASVAGFVAEGWGWGGRWSSAKDYMHLSANGR